MNRSSLLSLLVFCSLPLVACGGVVDDAEPAPGQSGASVEGGQVKKDGASVEGGQAKKDGSSAEGGQAKKGASAGAAACSQDEEGEKKFQDESEFVEAIAGVWSQCGEGSVFGTKENGLEIAADGRWYKLYDQGNGLVRGKGFDHQGTWEVIDTSAMNGPGVFQLNLDIDGGGGIITLPAIAAGPRKMRLNNMGVFSGDYAIDR